MTDTPADTLRDAKALISDPENWNKDGEYFKDGDISSDCFCVLGAVSKVSGTGRGFVRRVYISALGAALPDGHDSVISFNDDPNTTHPDMMAFLDRAIAIAETAE